MTEDITRRSTNEAVNNLQSVNSLYDELALNLHPLLPDPTQMTEDVAAFFKTVRTMWIPNLSRYMPNRGILTDWEISGLCTPGVMPWLKAPMLQPFVGKQVKTRPSDLPGEEERIISYGVSGFGYDCRLAPVYKVFTNATNDGGVIDPLDFKEDAYVAKEGPFCVIPPNSYILGHTVEYFTMPEDVVSICLGKSTYARCGIAVNVTPIEPGWEGHVTLEISNQTPLPIKVYANMGICQFLFFRGFRPNETYADKNGKYMGQQGITPARV